jgi:hypothetical protein
MFSTGKVDEEKRFCMYQSCIYTTSAGEHLLLQGHRKRRSDLNTAIPRSRPPHERHHSCGRRLGLLRITLIRLVT